MMKFFYWVALAFWSGLAPSALAQPWLAGSVVSVGDGDTLRVQTTQGALTIRLACIDAPETQQAPWGSQSARHLKKLLPIGTSVQLRVVEKDRYHRTVAEVYEGSQSINLQMVKEGQAVVYDDYLAGCSDDPEVWLKAEQQAQQAQAGLWKQTAVVMPWEFRRARRSSGGATPQVHPTVSPPAPPVVEAGNPCEPSYPDLCLAPAPPDLDCRDIPYRRFRVLPPDPHRLDGDKDGMGCES
ncbi:MAG: thermonuclease family protein [Cyanobacteriota bacterium]|nr:thermonuclease family protein [Cyanobacteriota bacterium]